MAVKVAVIGAGSRGQDAYGNYILKHPGDIVSVAVAEPDKIKRDRFAKEHGIPKKYQYESWEQLLSEEKLADGLIIATLDYMHLEPTLKAIEKGYDILLEKPISPTWEETEVIAEKIKTSNSSLIVAHVLRYTPVYEELKRILDYDTIGKIRHVNHIENVGFYHFAHSFVRGNWRNTDVAAPIILAKSCHDMDLLYWLIGKKCNSLSSFASLGHFNEKYKPVGAGDKCLDCKIEKSCPYSARKIYLSGNTGWPTSVITTDLSYTGIYESLESGPYGKCVYSCDNNVPDVQTVNMHFEDNIEVSFTLTAFSNEINRTTKIFGSKGEIRVDFIKNQIEVYKFGKAKEVITVETICQGHGGGDNGLMEEFVSILNGQETNFQESVESHLMAFAAEESRKENQVVELDIWRNNK